MADRRRWGLLIAGTGFLVSCGPPPQPKQMPPQSVSQQAPDPPPPSDPAPAAPVKTDTVIIVDKGEDDSKTPSIAEAGRAEKERRRTMDKPGVVINDKNLSQYAAKGQVTTAKAPEATAAKTPPSAPAAKDPHDESYWRARGLEIRQRWHDAADQVKAQQKSVEKLAHGLLRRR